MTKQPVLAVLATNVAILLAFGSLALSLPTYAPAVEATGLWTSVGCGALAAALVAASWARMPRGVRLIGAATVAMGLLGLAYSVNRLLM